MKLNKYQLCYLLIAFIGLLLSSAKWTIFIAPWIAYFFLLRFVQQMPLLKGFLITYIVTFVASTFAVYEVAPIPLPFLIIGLFLTGFITYIPFLLDKLWAHRIEGFAQTLIFPSAAVTLDYAFSFSGQGVWGSVANTQYVFLPLIQIASITGIWAITFLIHWFASAANYVFNHWQVDRSKSKKAIGIYGSVFAMVLIFGTLRLAFAPSAMETETVKIAGVSTENLIIWGAAYEDVTGEIIEISLKASQADPDLAKVSRAWTEFIENPDKNRFKKTYAAIDAINDQVFASSQKAVEEGAKIVVWTEALGATLKEDEQVLIERGQAFALQNEVYLCMTIAALKSGEITPESKFLENKLLTINPKGEILNEFHKNIPVGGVESIVPGDGNIPILETDYGKLSPSICYDADFPQHILQAGKKGTDIMVLPSGDWYQIAPYHSYMATMRAIENGYNLVRPVSHGISIATNAYGQTLAKHNFFEDADGILMAEVPTKGVSTIYPIIGDVFAWLCMTLLVVLGFVSVLKKFRLQRT